MQTVDDLAQLHRQGFELAASLPAGDLSRQYHPDLSPLGWHVGHCAAVEQYWLREVVLGRPPADAALHARYFPENCSKGLRAGALPTRDRLLDWVERVHEDNRALLADPPERAREHALMRGGYLPDFLAQHHAQHLETMAYALAQRALTADDGRGPRSAPDPRWPEPAVVPLAAGTWTIGSDGLDAYDNEQPAHPVELADARLARRPASNAEFLAFIEDGGYRRPELWSTAGWHWCAGRAIDGPVFWRRDDAGRPYELTSGGPRELEADAPVCGLGYWEAEAFAAWAGARLPHEYEWEALARSGDLQDTGRVWEWCANTLHPYPGFRPFPYERYSVPWFDGNHHVLRGGSGHTRDAVRRPSFRNFYEPDKRHLFAGVRLAWPEAGGRVR